MKPIKSAAAGIAISVGLLVLGAWLASTLAYSPSAEVSNVSQLTIEFQGTAENTDKVNMTVFNNAEVIPI